MGRNCLEEGVFLLNGDGGDRVEVSITVTIECDCHGVGVKKVGCKGDDGFTV